MDMWRHTIVQIRRAKSTAERRNIYRLFFNRRKQPHPILLDEELKHLLKIE
jgi:DNA-directed RNA polymerase subunit H (RpoH/RPB5)